MTLKKTKVNLIKRTVTKLKYSFAFVLTILSFNVTILYYME